MRSSILLGLSLCIVFTAATAVCQSSDSVGSVRTHIRGIDIPAIANAPFTAKIVVTWDQPLVGGGTLSRKYYTLVARDSQGRVRRETRDFVPANSNAEPPLHTFTIQDPISGTRTTCTQAWMTCSTGVFHARLQLPPAAAAGSNGNESRTDLGQRTIDNLTTNGIRSTASNTGATRVALTQTDEWYSPDLHMDLLVTRNSPQMGQVTLTVTELTRGEPDSSLFTIPSGYEVRGAASR